MLQRTGRCPQFLPYRTNPSANHTPSRAHERASPLQLAPDSVFAVFRVSVFLVFLGFGTGLGIYRYLSGIYHFLICFVSGMGEWYGRVVCEKFDFWCV